MFGMLVVDLLHEFELGVWKAVFIHLLRILDCENQTHRLDQRQVSVKISQTPVLTMALLDFVRYPHLELME
jgi:hypothetical protein